MGQLLCNWFYQLQPITGQLHCKLRFFSKYSGWWKKVFCLKRFYASSTNSPQRSFWSFYFFLNLLKLAEVFGLSCFVNLHCWNYTLPEAFPCGFTKNQDFAHFLGFQPFNLLSQYIAHRDRNRPHKDCLVPQIWEILI